MKKVFIEFTYNEKIDGELTSEDWDRIIGFIGQYGGNINIREDKGDDK